MSEIQPSESAVPPAACCAEPRRGFLCKLTALVPGAAAVLTPLGAGILAFLNPLRQKGQAGDYVRLGSLDTLPEDGTPVKASVLMDLVDAWNRTPNQPVGAVFLLRDGQKVKAFNVVCPHAGCSIEYKEEVDSATSEKVKKFFCPCHMASFDLSGQKTDAVSPSPRPMDSLVVDESRLPEVWVQFQNFQVGIAAKVPAA